MELLDRVGRQARGSVNSVRVRLVLLTISLLVPALLSMGFLLAGADRQSRAQTYQQMLTTARALSGTVDQQTAVGIAVVETLASDQALQSGDLKEFDTRARRVTAQRAGWVVVTDVAGQQVVNTLRPYGSPLPIVQRPQQLTRALMVGESRVSDLRVGRVAKKPVITVGARVDIKGQPHLLAYVVEAASFTSVFRQQRVPDHWIATLLDNDLKVIARSSDNAIWTGHAATPDMAKNLRQAREGVGKSTSLNGVPTMVAYTRSPQTGWTLMVAVPRAQLNRTAIWSVVVATSVFGVLLAFGVGMALFVSGGINRQVGGLVAAARAIGEGQAVLEPVGRSLEEVADIHAALAAASRELKAREERQAVMINELNHRVKNTLATVQALARQTFGKLEGAPVEAFTERLIALSGAHDLLTRTGWRQADLGELMQVCTQAHGDRVEREGPPVPLNPHTAVALSMVFHELATNSAKYGALSAPAGKVRIDWRMDPDEALVITWIETGGPPVTPPSKPGFGTRLIDSSIRRELKGEPLFEFRAEGLVFRATLPLSASVRWSNPF
ncbi:sensor histidine kinase [Caulobacter sp.]|uniref:sensor histidine kinase n=1 Tax=Caulobacter sp. TaxID=78 RepID=UPI003BA84380